MGRPPTSATCWPGRPPTRGRPRRSSCSATRPASGSGPWPPPSAGATPSCSPAGSGRTPHKSGLPFATGWASSASASTRPGTPPRRRRFPPTGPLPGPRHPNGRGADDRPDRPPCPELPRVRRWLTHFPPTCSARSTPFVHIVDSLFNQHAKWLKVSRGLLWQAPVASLNYLLTSHVWRRTTTASPTRTPVPGRSGEQEGRDVIRRTSTCRRTRTPLERPTDHVAESTVVLDQIDRYDLLTNVAMRVPAAARRTWPGRSWPSTSGTSASAGGTSAEVRARPGSGRAMAGSAGRGDTAAGPAR